MLIDGLPDFYLVQHCNTQIINVVTNTFDWIRAQPLRTVTFGCRGDDPENPVPNYNTQLQINNCKVFGPAGTHVVMLADLWTGDNPCDRNLIENIQVVQCELTMAQLVNHYIEPKPGVTGTWVFNRVTFQDTSPAQMFNVTLSTNTVVQILVWHCDMGNRSANSLFNIVQIPGGVNNLGQMEVTNTYFKSTSQPAAQFPTWLNDGIGSDLRVFHHNISRYNVNSAMGGPTLVALSSGP
jgi:hypothetical protein